MNRFNFCDSVAKIKKEKSFRFRNKSRAYFYRKKDKITLLTILTRAEEAGRNYTNAAAY